MSMDNPLEYGMISWGAMRGWLHRDECEMLHLYAPLYKNNGAMMEAVSGPGVPPHDDLVRAGEQQQRFFAAHPDVAAIIKDYEVDAVPNARRLCEAFDTHNLRSGPFAKLLSEARCIVKWRNAWDRLTPSEKEHVTKAVSGEADILPLAKDLVHNFRKVHAVLRADAVKGIRPTRAACLADLIPDVDSAQSIVDDPAVCQRVQAKLFKAMVLPDL